MKHVHIYFEISIQIYSERIRKINQIPNFQYYTRQFSKESYLVSIDYILAGIPALMLDLFMYLLIYYSEIIVGYTLLSG